MSRVNSFAEIDWHQFRNNREQSWKSEIQGKDKEFILQVDDNEYVEYLLDNYLLEPIELITDSETVEEPRTQMVRTNNRWGESVNRNSYIIDVSYRFTGTGALFSVRPNNWKMASYPISVNDQYKTVTFSIQIFEKNAKAFNDQKHDAWRRAFTNIGNINSCVDGYNRMLEQQMLGEIHRLKSSYQEENSFFEAINVKVKKDSQFVFTPPQIRKRKVPQPKIDNKREFKRYPSMADEMYQDILKLLMTAGRTMEQTPSLYEGRDEEGLRDQLLFLLAMKYESVTATGETFNKGGKTDILLKYAPENINIFVAECKFWKGAKSYLAAIDQLFDRYLSVRDTKVALIVFVKNKGFSAVLEEIKSATPEHALYRLYKGTQDTSRFTFEFNLSKEDGTKVFLTVLAFCFPSPVITADGA